MDATMILLAGKTEERKGKLPDIRMWLEKDGDDLVLYGTDPEDSIPWGLMTFHPDSTFTCCDGIGAPFTRKLMERLK